MGARARKEDSLFNLLTADEWQVPTISKQLFNIGVKGRDTYVQFHSPKDLRSIIEDEISKTLRCKPIAWHPLILLVTTAIIYTPSLHGYNSA